MATGPLKDIRILDFTHVWAGPLATRILGDLGAQIIKVEAPWARGIATQSASRFVEEGEDHWNRQGVTNKLNRNKRGICLDSKTDEGHKILEGLVKQCDVVIENFSARAMTSMGLGYQTLKQLNPQVIYVAMPGYGVSGPNKDFVAFGPSVEPMCGLTSFMGYSPEEPRVTAMAVPDACGGVTAAAAVMTALHRRKETGQGGFLELALHEAAIVLFGEYFLLDQLDELPQRMGNAHADYAPHGVYRCRGADEWIAIAIQNEDEWVQFSEYARQNWHLDSRFATLADRHTNRNDLDILIETWATNFDKIELMDSLQAKGIAAGALMVTPEFLNDPQIKDRDFFVELGSDTVEERPFPGLPFTIDGEKRGLDWTAAPKLGEHNTEVLKELLGMSDKEIQTLRRQGTITERPPAHR